MNTAVLFEDVSKFYRTSGTRSLKDLLLGASGHRLPRPERVAAVSQLSFTVSIGESIALLGHNGSGKSTVLKMLAGTVAPTHGSVWARGRIAPLLELGAGFHPDLTGRENIFLNGAILGLTRRDVRSKVDAIVAFSELEGFLDTPVKFYSSGMAVRLGFAIAVQVDPEILIVDEVLAVGDEDFQAKCMERMSQLRTEGRTIILVTHDFRQASSFCSRAIVLDHGRAIYDGEIAGAEASYRQSHRMSTHR